MDARTQELLDRLVAPGQFPNMSCSEGHELHEGITGELDRLAGAVEACSAQLLADTKSLAMETSMQVKGSASHWEEFMPPEWVEAQKVLKD